MAALSVPWRKRRPLSPLACVSCRGGREVNGVPCRDCSPERQAKRRRPLHWLADRLATPAGTAVGWSMASLPGLLGAAGVTYGLAVVVHSIWHQVPALGVAALAAGPFLLVLDRRL